jgi:hypothetical protein
MKRRGRKKEEGWTCGGFVAVLLVVADQRVAWSVVGSSSSLRIFLLFFSFIFFCFLLFFFQSPLCLYLILFFSFYSIAKAEVVTLEAG